MNLGRRIKAWRVLRLTRSYQKRFPAEADLKQKLKPGRIELTKRVEFNKRAIRIFVRDKELAELIISFRMPTEQRKPVKRIIEYALKKEKGDRQKAISFLKETQREINEAMDFGEKMIAKQEKKKREGRYKDKEKEYVEQRRHMYGTPFMLAGMTIEQCVIRMEGFNKQSEKQIV